jgi:hypothetical protein
VAETDYSKWDGSLSGDLRWVERQIILGCVDEAHRKELGELLDRDINLKGRTAFGYAYEAGTSRMSGSQTTTLGNSLLNAFVAYLAYRLAGMNENSSWRCIGPKFGDDGVDDIAGDWGRVGPLLGLKLKLEKRDTKDFVTFCGRVYVNPKGHCCSVFNPRKALQSLCVGLSNKDWADKVRGYAVTELQSPVVGTYLRVLMRVHGIAAVSEREWSETMGDWLTPYPYDASIEDQVRRVIAKFLNARPEDLSEFERRLEAVKTVAEFSQVDSQFFISVKRDDAADARFVTGVDGTVNPRLRGRNESARRGRRNRKSQ